MWSCADGLCLPILFKTKDVVWEYGVASFAVSYYRYVMRMFDAYIQVEYHHFFMEMMEKRTGR